MFTLGEIFPIAMGRRPIAISEENARVNTQEGRALKSPPFWTLKPTYGGYFPDFAITYSNFDTLIQQIQKLYR